MEFIKTKHCLINVDSKSPEYIRTEQNMMSKDSMRMDIMHPDLTNMDEIKKDMLKMVITSKASIERDFIETEHFMMIKVSIAME